MDLRKNLLLNGNQIKNFIADLVSSFNLSNALSQGRLIFSSNHNKIVYGTSAGNKTVKPEQSHIRTGTIIKFDGDSIYGSLSSPELGIIINESLDGAIIGSVALLFSKATTVPFFPSQFQIRTGKYVPNQVNLIYMHKADENLVVVTISQVEE